MLPIVKYAPVSTRSRSPDGATSDATVAEALQPSRTLVPVMQYCLPDWERFVVFFSR